MSAVNVRNLAYPVYELDSVSEDKLEAMILQLGLKKHSKTAMDPYCVICRQNIFWSKNAGTNNGCRDIKGRYDNNQCP